MKKIFTISLLLILCLSIVGCNKKSPDDVITIIHKSDEATNDDLINNKQYSENKWNYWAMVDNMPYFRTEKECTRIYTEPYDGVLTGKMSVDGLPAQNDTCNFGTDYPYMKTNTIDEIDVLIDGVWCVFERDMAEVNVKVKEATAEKVTLTVMNDNETMLMYGENYSLEYLSGDTWIGVDYIGNGNTSVNHSNILQPKATEDIDCDLTLFDINKYGNGTYRITRFGSTVEFELTVN